MDQKEQTKSGGERAAKPARKPSTARKGSPAPKALPERKCIVSGEHGSQDVLLRFVVGPDEALVPDVDGKLPGRGIWVTSDRAALQEAAQKSLFARAAKKPVKVPEDLDAMIEDLLKRRAIQSLALARRSGSVVAGFVKVETLLNKKPPLALLEASDGALDGRKKLMNIAKAWEKVEKTSIPVIGSLNSSELGLAFGRGSVIHAALENSGASRRVLADFQRLSGFRPQCPKEWARKPDVSAQN